MGFRFQDLMVDVLAAGAGQDEGDCPHDSTHDQGCGTTKDKDCPFDTTVDQEQDPCPFDSTITTDPDPEPPERRRQADLTLLKQQLHLALAELR